jgi:hypothetical protein
MKFWTTLSTPHGALGTFLEALKNFGQLSTPHGALGTSKRVFLLSLSTPHGALFIYALCIPCLSDFQLHTVH